jgi:chromosome segregation ATPase
MAKKKLSILVLGTIAVALLTMAGCSAKKHLATIEEQKAQLDQAASRIDELQQGNEALDKSLQDTKGLLDSAKSENKQLTTNLGSLKEQITTLENEKAELDKALAAGKETEASYQKKVRGLNGSISALKKKVAEMESAIAAKDAEISSLKTTGEAALKAAADDQARKVAALNSEKDVLSAQMEKTVSGKSRTIWILEILLALAVILAIVGFVRGRKK